MGEWVNPLPETKANFFFIVKSIFIQPWSNIQLQQTNRLSDSANSLYQIL